MRVVEEGAILLAIPQAGARGRAAWPLPLPAAKPQGFASSVRQSSPSTPPQSITRWRSTASPSFPA